MTKFNISSGQSNKLTLIIILISWQTLNRQVTTSSTGRPDEYGTPITTKASLADILTGLFESADSFYADLVFRFFDRLSVEESQLAAANQLLVANKYPEVGSGQSAVKSLIELMLERGKQTLKLKGRPARGGCRPCFCLISPNCLQDLSTTCAPSSACKPCPQRPAPTCPPCQPAECPTVEPPVCPTLKPPIGPTCPPCQPTTFKPVARTTPEPIETTSIASTIKPTPTLNTTTTTKKPNSTTEDPSRPTEFPDNRLQLIADFTQPTKTTSPRRHASNAHDAYNQPGRSLEEVIGVLVDDESLKRQLVRLFNELISDQMSAENYHITRIILSHFRPNNRERRRPKSATKEIISLLLNRFLERELKCNHCRSPETNNSSKWGRLNAESSFNEDGDVPPGWRRRWWGPCLCRNCPPANKCQARPTCPQQTCPPCDVDMDSGSDD